MGRRTKLTPERSQKIVDAIRAGNYREVAAQWGGIDIATFCRWMIDPREPYRAFREAVIAAECEAEVRAVAELQRTDDPKHREWWLERKFYERWGRKDRLAVTGANNGPIQVQAIDPTKLSDEDLAQLVALLDRAAPRSADSEGAANGVAPAEPGGVGNGHAP